MVRRMTLVAYVAYVAPGHIERESVLSNYLKIAEKAKTPKSLNHGQPNRHPQAATKATKATKAPDGGAVRTNTPRNKSDQSDQRVPNFTPLTVSEALAEMNRWGSGPGRNVELYRRGELSEEQAVEYVTCAILHRRGDSFGAWKHHAPAVRKALTLCIHELAPADCKVCNGYVKRLIGNGE